MKRNGFYIAILAIALIVGMYASQSIFWYRVGPNGKTWTTGHSWSKNETNYKRVRGEFPKTVLTSDRDEECGCVGG